MYPGLMGTSCSPASTAQGRRRGVEKGRGCNCSRPYSVRLGDREDEVKLETGERQTEQTGRRPYCLYHCTLGVSGTLPVPGTPPVSGTLPVPHPCSVFFSCLCPVIQGPARSLAFHSFEVGDGTQGFTWPRSTLPERQSSPQGPSFVPSVALASLTSHYSRSS